MKKRTILKNGASDAGGRTGRPLGALFLKFRRTGLLAGRSAAFLIPLLCAVALSAALLTVNAARYELLGYAAESGWAVPEGRLEQMLKGKDDTDALPLTRLEMGTAIYEGGLFGSAYYLGTERELCVSAGYPVFARSGQVLYFLNPDFLFVTEDWDFISSYDGLFLSDGITYNMDGSRADGTKMLLVKVNGGYQLAQSATVERLTGVKQPIGAYSVCAFGNDSIVYYSYDNGVLIRGEIPVTESSIIAVGDVSEDYATFMKNLGLWEEMISHADEEPKATVTPEPASEEEGKASNAPGEETPIPAENGTGTELGGAEILSEENSGTAGYKWQIGGQKGEPGAQERPERQPSARKTEEKTEPESEQGVGEGNVGASTAGTVNLSGDEDPNSQSQAERSRTEAAAPAKKNPNAVPAAPDAPSGATDVNPDYQKPEVSFSDLEAWVYSVSLKAKVSDPAKRITGSGVSISVYKLITRNGSTSKEMAMRRYTSASDAVLGFTSLEPDTKYWVEASYTYLDKYNNRVKESAELGEIRTLPLSELRPLNFSFYGETTVPEGAAPVEIFGDRLQLRNLVFGAIANGKTSDPDAGVYSAPPSEQIPEAYVVSIEMTITDRKYGSTRVTSLGQETLMLLRAGYMVTHCETGAVCSPDREYTYTLILKDRFGNQFILDENSCTEGEGHTCKRAPTVKMTAPEEENVLGKVQLDTVWSNPDTVTVAPNTAEGAAMGDGIVAGIIVVPEGVVPCMENAVKLTAHPTGSEADAVSGQKILPIGTESHNKKTSWTITDGLAISKNYTAVVLCGFYNNGDNLDHYDAVLEESLTFTTESLKAYGTVSYTSKMVDVEQDSATLRFRMDAVRNDLLLPLLSDVTVTLEDGKGGKQTMTLKREELSTLHLGTWTETDAGWSQTVQIPVWINGEAAAGTAALTLECTTVPDRYDGFGVAETVWDYLLASSKVASTESCWLSLRFGSALEMQEGHAPTQLLSVLPKTKYTGSYLTNAYQGGAYTDVSNGDSRKHFTFVSSSTEAVTVMDNAFISTGFIQLYDLRIEDDDESVLPDDSDRGGGNVLLRVSEYTETNGVKTPTRTVASRYINSAETYDVLKIGGLENEKDYLLSVSAVKYRKNGATELNYDLLFQIPQDPQNPRVYAFTTGQSVVGDLSLTGVKQLYTGDDGAATTAISLLDEADFYYGAWGDGANVYFYSSDYSSTKNPVDYDKSYRQAYVDMIDSVEDTEELRTLARGERQENQGAKENPVITIRPSTSTFLQDVWTTKFIPVSPGEEYSVFNTSVSESYTYTRVAFFYRDTSGNIKYYTGWSDNNLLRGSVFRVPSTADGGNINSDRICYMRISGWVQRDAASMILTRYDDSMASGPELVTDEVREGLMSGMVLSASNVISTDVNGAYTTDYISVSGGSVYMLRGRDVNKIDERSRRHADSSGYGRVLFYDANHVYLGSYNVGYTTALVKAPFGAVFCRFNLRLDQSSGVAQMTDRCREELSMKLFREAEQGAYLVEMSTVLTDQSEEQLLREGKVKVTLYTTLQTVTDQTDLESETFVEYGDAGVWSCVPGAEDFNNNGYLNLNRTLSFAGLRENMGYKAVLEIFPRGWGDRSVALDTVYFNTNRVVYEVYDLKTLMAVRNDPAGSYVVTADIDNVTGQILGEDRPFNGTIDFQGHTVTTTSTNPLFFRVSASGVVKNLVLNYSPHYEYTTAYGNLSALVRDNYGLLQNIVLNYDIENMIYGVDVGSYSGGIARINYGKIDGFVVRLKKDIRIFAYFGGVCYSNYGTVSNGYVCGDTVTDPYSMQSRSARIIHVWKYNEEIVSTTVPYVGYAVGLNSIRGKVQNTFVVGDLVIESDDATTEHSNADFSFSAAQIAADPALDKSRYETSTTNTAYAAVLVGYNSGEMHDSFAVGDRLDYDPDTNTYAYMVDRGAAVGYVNGLYIADNIVYFSEMDTTRSYCESTAELSSTVRSFNIRGRANSLYDYMWYETQLGKDGDRFSIRANVEDGDGYFPTLILPDCFPVNVQPRIELPAVSGNTIEVLSNEVREQGVNEALVTLVVDFPQWESGHQITDVSIYDSRHSTDTLKCEILDQKVVGDAYRLDLLLSLGESTLAENSYYVGAIRYTGGIANLAGAASARTIPVAFWRELTSKEQWKSELCSGSGTITGNYLLSADLDFSESTTYKDWMVSRRFSGTLNGGIYSDKAVILTDCLGKQILDEYGDPREIRVWDEMTGMHTVSGVGNLDANGEYMESRDYTRGAWYYGNSLIVQSYGTVENMIFRDFESTTAVRSGWTFQTYYSGVVGSLREGARMINCHVRDSSFFGCESVGSLVGNCANSTIRNCSAGNVRVESYRWTDSTVTASVGGLVGYCSGGVVDACFTSDISVIVSDLYGTNGVGGLVGYLGDSVLSDCYTLGTVDAAVNYVGGVIGQVAGTSEVSGCWSGATVLTVGDYAGGIVGYHNAGVLRNCYTYSAVITRSFAASHVHRVCSATAYSETSRFAIYAFAGQSITYYDADFESKGLSSPYQFGTCDDFDGATNLLKGSDLRDPGTWQNVIGVGESYDLTGTALRDISGRTPKKVSGGYLPKLKSIETGRLLYDQPDVQIDYARNSVVMNPYSGAPDAVNEKVQVHLFISSTAYPDIGTANFATLIDWDSFSIIGAVIDKTNYTDSPVPGVRDLGQTTRSGHVGREFEFTMVFGDEATRLGIDGHYLDSYIVVLTLNHKDNTQETIHARIALSTPIYRTIPDIDSWDSFFSQERYASAFENIQITGPINFNAQTTYSRNHGGSHVTNVRVNRLDGKAGSESVITTSSGTGGSVTFTRDYYSLISRAVTSVDGMRFENITLRSDYKDSGGKGVQRGGNVRGIIGYLTGDITNCTFKNIDIDGGTSSYYGCIGQLGGLAENVTLTNISVVSRGERVGGLVGMTSSSVTLRNITMNAEPGKRNTVVSRWSSFVGGVVGYLNGIASDITVTDTDVSGRSYVGGVAGYTPGDAGRPEEKKLKNITVGEYVDERTPGATDTPSVTVSMDGDGADVLGSASTAKRSEHRYFGGVVGYGADRGMENLQVYNVLVRADYRSEVEDTINANKGPTYSKVNGEDSFDEIYSNWNTDRAEYRYFVGGIVGASGGGTTDSVAKNCTVVSYGGAAGGVSGGSSGGFNRTQDCLVYAIEENARLVGGLKIYGGAYRSTVEHSVVVGGHNVGGLVGFASDYCRESGTIDTVVIGKENVGGAVGANDQAYFYTNYVMTSETPVPIDLDAIAWPAASPRAVANGADEGGGVVRNRLWKNAERSFLGTHVIGSENVGGLIGLFRSLYMYDNYVTSNVTVRGKENVGGAVGCFLGWEDGRWNGTNRNFYRNLVGTDVSGDSRVGGLIGYYSRYDNPDTIAVANVASAFGPYTGSFYGNLFTGSVTGSESGFTLGAYDDALLEGWAGTRAEKLKTYSVTPDFGYTRIYEESTLNGTRAAELGLYDSYDAVKDLTASDLTKVNNGQLKSADRTNRFYKTLTVNAEDLADPNLYFLPADKDYGGLNLSRATWGEDTLWSAFTQTSPAASFSSYRDGIKTDSSLVLWLDARNNTGAGYTDSDSGVWKDLSGSGNDATLYWNGKSRDIALTMGEWYNYMFWNEGALEYHTTSESYYAELAESISPVLQGDADGYTVEFVYTVLTPYMPRTYYLMTWRENGVTGGFNAYYGYDQTYGAVGGAKNGDGIGIWNTLNSAGTGTTGSWWTWYNGSKDKETVYRTVTFTVGGKNSSNKCTADFYINGEPVWYEVNNKAELQQRGESGTSTYASENVSFRDSENLSWRLRSASSIRLYGVRVYSKALTAEERRQNAAYDQWYYFGGDIPEGASGTGGTAAVVSAETSGLPSGMLFRCDVANYNGTLVDSHYQAGTSLGSRGYYYTKSGGRYSDIVYVDGPAYGPYFHSASLNGEYFGATRYRDVFGQEGADTGGSYYSTDDTLHYGGYRMPDVGREQRYPAAPLTLMRTTMRMMSAAPRLPELTAYASGVDRINLELSDFPSTALICTVTDGEDRTLFTGEWPTDRRTLTLTYDFRTDVTVTLEGGGLTQTLDLSAERLARTVMTYGDSYWYLCDDTCWSEDGEQMGSGSTRFIHMMNGQLLDAEGQLWSAESNSAVGIVQPFIGTALRPLSSADIDGAGLASYGTYFCYGDVCRDQQMIVRDGRIYTMPGSQVVIGSFVADAYGGSCYSTVLTSSGMLTDLGSRLDYPDEFSNADIRETSCTLGYSGTKLLIRYNSGNLVAFDYLTGETDNVKVPETRVSFVSFLLTGIFGTGTDSLWDHSGQTALTAADYQEELDNNPKLQNAMTMLKSRDQVETASEAAEPEEIPAESEKTDSSVVSAETAVRSGTESTKEAEKPDASGSEPKTSKTPETNEGSDTNAVSASDTDGVKNQAEAESASDPKNTGADAAAGAENGLNAVEDDALTTEGSAAAVSVKYNGKEVPQVMDSVPTAAESYSDAAAVKTAKKLQNLYVTVYDAATGDSQVYDVADYLTLPEEELVSEESYVSELRKLGYESNILGKENPKPEQTNGLTLVSVTAAATVALLIGMVILKKKKLDQQNRR